VVAFASIVNVLLLKRCKNSSFSEKKKYFCKKIFS